MCNFVFREFTCVCDAALELNDTLISSDQIEYQQALKAGFTHLLESLSELLGTDNLLSTPEPSRRRSAAFFSMISSTPGSSNA